MQDPSQVCGLSTCKAAVATSQDRDAVEGAVGPEETGVCSGCVNSIQGEVGWAAGSASPQLKGESSGALGTTPSSHGTANFSKAVTSSSSTTTTQMPCPKRCRVTPTPSTDFRRRKGAYYLEKDGKGLWNICLLLSSSPF